MSPEARTTFSPDWDTGDPPKVAAVVSTYRRAQFLPGLLEALAVQTLDARDYEIILVDNGSADETADLLQAAARTSPLRMAAISLGANRGPGGGRNCGLALVRAPVVAITDDDCLPTPDWLEAMLEAARAGADLIQGEVHAAPDGRDRAGPWDHTKWITAPTPFFETCNVAYRTSYVRQVGGFDEEDPLTAQIGGRAFGEDALLAWRIQEAGGKPAFCHESVVHHRVIPADYRQFLRDQRNLVGFPGLAARSPLVGQWFWRRHFLSKQTAVVDLALTGLAIACCTRRRWPLVAALPWLWLRVPYARLLAGPVRGRTPLRLAQLALGDVVSMASLVEGSVRHRRLVL